MIDSGLNSNW